MKEILFSRTIKEHREIIANLKSPFDCAKGVEIIEMPEIRLYRNFNADKTISVPTIFFLPGTGFVARETSFTDVACSHISATSKCQVICINHKLAPEFQFPYGARDAYRILQETLAKSNTYNINKTKIAIMGYSSGGNFAALLAIWATKNKEQKNIRFAKQVLISPGLDLSSSITDFKNEENQDKFLNNGFKQWTYNNYVPAGVNCHDPEVSPVWTDEKYLHDLPPTDIIVASHDCCRGDSELYYKKLTHAGVLTTKREIPGHHDYFWKNTELFEFIGLRMKNAFATFSIEHPLKQNNGFFSMITFEKKDGKLIIQARDNNRALKMLVINFFKNITNLQFSSAQQVKPKF